MKFTCSAPFPSSIDHWQQTIPLRCVTRISIPIQLFCVTSHSAQTSIVTLLVDSLRIVISERDIYGVKQLGGPSMQLFRHLNRAQCNVKGVPKNNCANLGASWEGPGRLLKEVKHLLAGWCTETGSDQGCMLRPLSCMLSMRQQS